MIDMACSRAELADCPLCRLATVFPARPGTRCPNGELQLRGDRKKFQNVQVELRDYDSALRSARGKADPGGSGAEPLECRAVAPARYASDKRSDRECWRGPSRAPARLLALHASCIRVSDPGAARVRPHGVR